MFAEVKKLNKKTASRLAATTAVAVCVVIAVLCFTMTWPKRPQYCAKCHVDTSFNNACKKPGMEGIVCVECHAHKNKGTAIMAAEIKNDHCTSESCHPGNKLFAKSVRFEQIKPFQHKTHLTATQNQGETPSITLPLQQAANDAHENTMHTENLLLRCTSCHASLRGEKHFETDINTCYICHFTTQPFLYSKDNIPIKDCTLCHDHIEITREIYGKTFKHDEYPRAACTDCHFNTIQGGGSVTKKSCVRCHSSASDNFNNASDMHQKHIVLHKTACSSCHTPITHGWNKKDNTICIDEPLSADFKIQSLIMQGAGGFGVQGTPDPMYLATVNCTACHTDKQLKTRIKPSVCGNCHPMKFNKIVSEQKRFVTSQMRLLKTLLTKAKKHVKKGTHSIIHEAEANYQLITEDGSKGVHNIKYVKDLLSYSISNLQNTIKKQPYD